MQKLTRTLRSPRLAWWILVVLLGCLLVSFLIPQRPVVGEAIYATWKADAGLLAVAAESLGLASVFTSWPFLIAMALLFVNLSFCTAHRISARRRTQTRTLQVPADAVEFDIAPDAEPTHVRALGAGWALRRPAADQYAWERGAWGWRGSVLMHLGLLVLLAAGVVSGMTRFSGELVLAEGQTIVDSPDAYTVVTQAPRYGAGFSGAALTCQNLEVAYDGSTIVDVVASMSEGPQGVVRPVRVNTPFRAGGKAYLLSKSGHAVALRVTEGSEVLMDAVVNPGGVSARGNTDSIVIRPGLEVTMTVLPDGVGQESGRVQRRLLLADPVVEVKLHGSESPALLRPGQAAQVGPVSVEIRDVLYWTQFLARSDKGLPIAYLAFVMILAGIVVRWLDPDVRLALVVSNGGSTGKVWYRTRFNDAIGQRVAEKLIAELSGVDREQEVS